MIDKLCDKDWIERRGDEPIAASTACYLTQGRARWSKLGGLRSDITATALEGINPADAHRLLVQLEAIKENVRNTIQKPAW